ncbi:Chromosomal replication initiator protein DnaA [Candidatus Magnetaquicoccaceae bacterium FCR-1]|uniref:Chromosomal replication initiator protein DnaA n=1 Tax=Candidatus Magnetaquiglobus chichijimensis TaxID=3141448 RepID=A0ABQ0C547_9PROT
MLQLILSLGVDPLFTFGNFIVGTSNRLAHAAVGGVMESPATSLLLIGEAGCGKSHLLHAAVADRQAGQGRHLAVFLDPEALGLALADGGEGALTGFLERWSGRVLVAVDNLERIAAGPEVVQEGLLFLFNHLRACDGRLLVASRLSPVELTALRADLRSRLLWGQMLEIAPPDDAEREAILAKLAADRQVRMNPEVIRFLCARLPRRIPDLAEALDRLDRAGLERIRPLTVPLAKEILGL